MVKYIHKKCVQHRWLEPASDGSSADSISATTELGVVLRRTDGSYATEPSNVSRQLSRAAGRLEASVAFCMSSGITEALFEQLTPLQTKLQLDPFGAFLPVVNSIDDLCSDVLRVSQEAYMCACRRERFIFVWGVSPQSIVAHGSDVETRLVGVVRICSISTFVTMLMILSGLGKSHGR